MSDDKKIIIDEDWKNQVQAEKEAAAHKQAPAPKSEAAPPAEVEAGGQHDFPFPPASFPFLLSTLATPAFIALGQVPNPLTGQIESDRDQARHFIDMLAMLQEKTAGNLTSEEAIMLDQLLHELRLIFVTGQNSDQRAEAAKPK